MMSDLVYIQKIAENQTGRTTWIAKFKGTKCIAKKISVDSPEKKDALINQLKGQVTYSERLSGDDRRKIILFNQMIEDRGAVVFLRDFVDGDSLENLISDRMEWKEAIKWMKNIASIVQRSHDTYHVLHGDLKPANILQRSDKTLCIIDWDTMRISEQVEIISNRTRSISDMPGTPEYMSPEQCAGKKCDFQTDVYALGVILYRLLTGDFPFSGSPMQIISRKQEETLPPFVNRFPTLGVPHDLGKLIDDSLQKDQNKRIRNIDEFIEKLERIIDDSKASVMPQIPPRGTPTSPNVVSSNNPTKEERPIGKRTKDDSSIVIIGPTQSGKTVLAAGLYRSHSGDFNVSALDDKTRQYADQIGSFLQNGNWPAATTKNEVIKLLFKLDIKDWTGTRSGIVEFKEYSGEHMRKENYYQEIIGKPEVVLMLFNPGTPWIADTYPNKEYKNPSEKNDAAFHLSEFISQMKGCINYMVSLPNPPAIAVVITAADRLESDLKPYKDHFERVVSEICDALTLNNCTWKRFEVSVCKPLAKQDELDFNPQHIHEPFVWALNRKRLGRILKKFALAAACLLGVFLVCWALLGMMSNSEKKKASLITQQVAQLDKDYTNRSTVVKQKEYVEKLRDILNNNKSYKFWFNKYENQYVKSKTELESKIDSEYIEYLTKLLAEYQKPDSTAKIGEMRNQLTTIKQWQPCVKGNKENQKKIETLTTQLENLIIDKSLLEFENQFAEIKSKNDDKTDSLLALQKNVNNFSNMVPKDGVFRNRYNALTTDIVTEISRRETEGYDEFVRSTNGISAKDALEKLENEWLFNDSRSKHPKLPDVEKFVYGIVEKDMINNVRQCLYGVNNQTDYEDLKRLCGAVKGTHSKYIQKQKLFEFAKAYFYWYDNTQGRNYTITINCVYGKSSYTDGGYVTAINSKSYSWDSYIFISEKKIDYSESKELEPWKSYVMAINHSINVKWGFDPTYQPCYISIHPLAKGTHLATDWYPTKENSFKVIYTVSGTLLGDLVREYNLPISLNN